MNEKQDLKAIDVFKETMAFLDAQYDAEMRGEHTFTCPICGKIARWVRADGNGHLHAECVCGIRVCE